MADSCDGCCDAWLNCDFDRLHDLVNEHNTLRQFLGHADIWDKKKYSYQSVVDNVSLLTPELLAEVGKLFVGSGHKIVKKPGGLLHGRCGPIIFQSLGATALHSPVSSSH